MVDLFNVRTLAYYSMLPHVKDLPKIEKFMPLPIDDMIKNNSKKRVQHPWAELSEDELREKFGD